MDKKNKGLVDNDEGEFTLNESGTSVSIDAPGEKTEQTKKTMTGKMPHGDTNISAKPDVEVGN